MTVLGLVTAVMVVLPQTTAVARATGSIKLVGRTQPVLIGDPITLAGKFRHGGHRVFVIQRAKSTSSRWHTVKGSKGKTNGRGKYHATVTATNTFIYRAVLKATTTKPQRVSGELTVEAVTGWRQVTDGGTHVCGIWSDNTLWCWGNNTNGELGNSTSTSSANPTPVQVLINDNNPETWLSVSAGGGSHGDHTCAIRSDQSLWCWGDNYYGQLGYSNSSTGTDNNPNPPAEVSVSGGPTKWLSVVASEGAYTCAIGTDYNLWCWGRNNNGQLATTTNVSSELATSPTRVTVSGGPQTWVDVSAEIETTCALSTDLTLWCWGANGSDQLATNAPGGPTPREVSAALGVQAWFGVAAAASHTCAIFYDLSLYCWGSNLSGALGNSTDIGTSVPNSTPTKVLINNNPVSWLGVTAAASDFTCAVQADLTLWCWGDNTYGELGDASNNDAAEWAPFNVTVGGNPTTWVGLDTGESSTCAIRSDYTLWCWGDNNYGNLGTTADNGVDAAHATPVEIPTPTPAP